MKSLYPRSAILVAVAIFHTAAQAGEVTFERRAFDYGEAVWATETIDVNSDGKLDLVVAGTDTVWAQLAPDWQRVTLAETPGGFTIHAVKLDCDLDGDMDLAVGRPRSDWIVYREAIKAGKKPKQPVGEDWTVAWLENTGKPSDWPLHIVDREMHGVHGVWFGDVDGDGHDDLLADAFAGPHLESSLAWYQSVKGTSKPMPRHIITDGKATGRPHYMDFADINADGRGDVLLGATTEGSMTWWEQPADPTSEWTRHLVAMEPGVSHPRAVDLNGDGKLDIYASAGHGVGVMWFEAPDWKKHSIDDSFRDVHAFDAADIDGDGDIDCAGCSFSQMEVRWYENLGDGKYRTHVVDKGNNQQAYDLKLLDLDQDGRLDILLAGRRSDNAVWYRNAR